MSWHDFKNHQFIFNGKTYSLCKPGWIKGRGFPIKHSILFLLNIHRGRFVNTENLLEFIYEEQNPDEWADNQDNSVRVTVFMMRKSLPEGVSIKYQQGFGYKLEVGEDGAEA